MTATPPPPRPVEHLQYDSTSPHPFLPSLLRAVGLLLLVLGALQVAANATLLASWLLHLADPYYWEVRKNAVVNGLPSSYLLTAVGVTELLSGLAALLAGLACLTRRASARELALAYAFTQIASRVLMTATWLPTSFQSSPLTAPPAIANAVSQISWFVASVGLPSIVLVLAARSTLWPKP